MQLVRETSHQRPNQGRRTAFSAAVPLTSLPTGIRGHIMAV